MATSTERPTRSEPQHQQGKKQHRSKPGKGGGGGSKRRPPGGNVGRGASDDELLRRALVLRGAFDTPDGLRRRKSIIRSLEAILENWATSLHPIGGVASTAAASYSSIVSSSSSHSIAKKPKQRVAVVCFGSYRLGVHRPCADIDALALSPPHCTRADFFASLVKLLRTDARVSDLHPVSGAYTPVIKFAYDGINIDLVFARLSDGAKLQRQRQQQLQLQLEHRPSEGDDDDTTGPTSRAEFEIDDADLIGLDEAGVRSLNGARVAQLLLSLVPDIEAFRLTVRAVKEWAAAHGLYSNVLGFLGGVNWAILVAWVCMRNEGAPASTLLRLFMQTFSRWRWPKPVRLGPISYSPPSGVPPLKVWNPKANSRDRDHMMPIITPAYPAMNSSYNVGSPQLRRMRQEFYHAEQLLARIDRGENEWEDLFVGNDFFRQHANYLEVDIIARNENDFRAWFGLCESRLRILIVGLESSDYGVHAFPFAKFFRRKVVVPDPEPQDDDDDDDACQHIASFFIALRFAPGMENVDLRPCADEFLYKVNSWEGRSLGMDLTIGHKRQTELPSFVFEDEEGLTDEKATRRESGKGTESKSPRDDVSLPLRQKDKNQKHAVTEDTNDSSPPDPSSFPSPCKRPRRQSPEAP